MSRFTSLLKKWFPPDTQYDNSPPPDPIAGVGDIARPLDDVSMRNLRFRMSNLERRLQDISDHQVGAMLRWEKMGQRLEQLERRIQELSRDKLFQSLL